MAQDKRAQRTKMALRNALLSLMMERGYESLTVQQILDRAAVGRATFYLHYRSKEDLLRGSLDELRAGLLGEVTANEKRPLGFSLGFFQHVDGHRKLYRAIVGRESGMIVDKEIRRLLSDLVRSELAAAKRDALRVELAAQSVAGAMLAVVTWWLDRNIMLTALELNEHFRALVLPGLEAQIRAGT